MLDDNIKSSRANITRELGPDLLKILNSSLEHTDIVVTRDITIAARADALAMAHLAEDPAVRRGNALNGKQRTVGVECSIHGGIAFQIHILGSDLTIDGKLMCQFFGCEEAAFTV